MGMGLGMGLRNDMWFLHLYWCFAVGYGAVDVCIFRMDGWMIVKRVSDL